MRSQFIVHAWHRYEGGPIGYLDGEDGFVPAKQDARRFDREADAVVAADFHSTPTVKCGIVEVPAQ